MLIYDNLESVPKNNFFYITVYPCLSAPSTQNCRGRVYFFRLGV